MTNYAIKNNSLKSKEDYVNRRISHDLKKHNWLMEKLRENNLIIKTDTGTKSLKSPKQKPEKPKSAPKCEKESVAGRSTLVISKSKEDKEKELDKYLEYAKRLYRKLKDRKKLNLHSQPKRDKYKKTKVERRKTIKSAPSFGTVEDLFDNINLFEKENEKESTNNYLEVKDFNAVECKEGRKPENTTKINVKNSNKVEKKKLSSRIVKHKRKHEENPKTINYKLQNNLTCRVNNFYTIESNKAIKLDVPSSKTTKKLLEDNVCRKIQPLSTILNNFKNRKKEIEPEEINVKIRKEYLFSDTTENLQEDNYISIAKKSLLPMSNNFKNSKKPELEEINVTVKKEYLFSNTTEQLQEDNYLSFKREPHSHISNNLKNSKKDTNLEEINAVTKKITEKLQEDNHVSIKKEPLSPTAENFIESEKETNAKEIIIIPEDDKLKTYSVQAQTESVFIISAEEQELIEFLKSKNLTKLKIEKLLEESSNIKPITSKEKEAIVIKNEEDKVTSNGITHQAELLQAFLNFCDEYKKNIDELGEKISICTQLSTKETENQEIASLAELIGKELGKMSRESQNMNQNLDRMLQSHQNQIPNTTPTQSTQELPNDICLEVQQLQNIFPHQPNNQQHFGQRLQSYNNQPPNINHYQSINQQSNISHQLHQQPNQQQHHFSIQPHHHLNQLPNHYQPHQQCTSTTQITHQRHQMPYHSQSSVLQDLLRKPDPQQSSYRHQQLPQMSQQYQQRQPDLQRNLQRQQDLHRLSLMVPPVSSHQTGLTLTPERPMPTSQGLPNQLVNLSQSFQTTYNSIRLPPKTTYSLQTSNYQPYPPNHVQKWHLPLL